jgi:hypothetical protein
MHAITKSSFPIVTRRNAGNIFKCTNYLTILTIRLRPSSFALYKALSTDSSNSFKYVRGLLRLSKAKLLMDSNPILIVIDKE